MAADMIHKVKSLCKECGLNLLKFYSNHAGALRSISMEHRKDEVNDKDLNLGTLCENKVKWNIQEDTLRLSIRMNEKPETKHELLAALSSVSSPLSLEALFLLKDRLIIQRLCKNNLKWDKLIDDKSTHDWLKWRNNLMTLNVKSIARCMNPNNFGNITR